MGTRRSTQRSITIRQSSPSLEDSLLNARRVCNELLNLGIDGLQQESSMEAARLLIGAAREAINEVKVRTDAVKALCKATQMGVAVDPTELQLLDG